jgi:DNA modification methylase
VTSIKDLKHDHKNARKRTDRSAALIAESLKRFGAARSIVIDEDGRILAGNGTVEGARKAGIDKLRIIEAEGDELIAVRRTGLSEDDKVGLALADNRSSDLSEWDNEMLRQLSEEYDLTPWFEDDELLAEVLDAVEGKTDPDDVPEPPTEPITKPGDLWILGSHRLLCGDSTDVLAVERLMDGKKADMVFTDPPYNIGFGGTMSSTSKDGKLLPYVTENAKHAAIHNDKKTPEEFQDFISSVLSIIRLHCAGAYYISFGSGNFHELLTPVASSIGYKSIVIWVKNQSPMGGGAYRRRYEPIVYGNFSADFYGKPYAEDDVWEFDRTNKNDLHPTMKPVDLVANAISHGSKPGGSVLDLFMGSGTTIIAAEQQRRSAYGMELDPAYCDVIVKRWEDFTGNTAVCVPSDQHFTEQQEAF